MPSPTARSRSVAAASKPIQRFVGWYLYLAPVSVTGFLLVRYALHVGDRPVHAVLFAAQALSGPFAWLLVGVHHVSDLGWIFALIAATQNAGYGIVVRRTAEKSWAWIFLHFASSCAWCFIGLMRVSLCIT